MTPITTRLIDCLATTDALDAVFSDAAILGAMLDFEVALARAEVRAGVIPAGAGSVIGECARIEDFDIAQIAAEARTSATISIPIVQTLRRLVQRRDEASAAYVHWGATSQDVADTALVVCIRKAGAILAADHRRLLDTLVRLSDVHADTVMLGRTLMQPALPITFGLKTAGWAESIARAWRRVEQALTECAVLQFGGAAGTLAALGSKGNAVEEALAAELDLPISDGPWHSHRERFADLICCAGVYTSALGKIARDVSLLMQDEVGEVSERGGGSSAMPHKRNPSGCAIALAASVRMPGLVSSYLSGAVHEHERALGGWHSELPTIAAAMRTTGSGLAAMLDVVEGLVVFPDRMRSNLDATHGVVFAEKLATILAPKVGRDAAERLLAEAVTRARGSAISLTQAAETMPDLRNILSADDLAHVDDPGDYLGSAETFRKRLIVSATRRSD